MANLMCCMLNGGLQWSRASANDKTLEGRP
jgi:hypothetical protein